jgi:hypothetical protein
MGFLILRAGARMDRILLWGIPGLILMIKPQMGLAFLPVLAFWPLSSLGLLGLSILGWYFLPAVKIGFPALLRLFQDWALCLKEQQTPEFLSVNINQSLAAALARMVDATSQTGNLTMALLPVFLAIVVWIRIRVKREQFLSEPHLRVIIALFGLSGFLVFSPLSWRWMVSAWAPFLALLVPLPRGRVFLASGCVLAAFTHSHVGGWIELLHEDGVSFYGVYAWVNICLFIALLRNLAAASVMPASSIPPATKN